ncbi:zinc finger and SCAN domain-containing protein 5B-like [Pseudoliparis swirei]|uniref:zinc finger and SCAN domain-containing protein 5B-like n=1 Tax=Pseudoliparis swirei TaxID=2059687 RepID=UPI0024BE0EA3|nr:zinc finger and SCAN domain-containing protein 5B-like [Pseudoliparis swirei]
MSKAQMLRGLVNQRLTAAAQEICGLFEGTIAEYEEELCSLKEENERHRKLLHAVFNPEVRLQRADVQQLLVVKEEVPSEQQVWSFSLDQVHPEPPLVKEDQEDPEPPHIKEEQEDPEPPHIKEEQDDPEPPHIKEEQEELWTSQEGEQLQGLEEAGLKFSFTPVKSEAEEETQSSQLHQRRTEPMEIEADGDDCGGPEPARNPDPDRPPDPDEETGDSSEPDTDDSVDWKKTREPQAGLNSLSNDDVSVSDSKCSSREKPFSCSICKTSFAHTSNLKRHMLTHTGEKPFSCSVCKRCFRERRTLKTHMLTHTGEKPFTCSVCKTSFAQRGTLKSHMLTHTGEKPFSCSVCKRCFTGRGTKDTC